MAGETGRDNQERGFGINAEKKLAAWGYLGETKARSWVKSIVWRLIGVFILGGIIWLFTHDWQQTTWITVIFHGIRTILYFYHERVWNKISWGRIKANEQARPTGIRQY